jgi:hypothetical protein
MPREITGKGAIVLRLQNGHRFYEHSSIGGAKGEAARLSSTIGGVFAVYVPVALIEQPPLKETRVHVDEEELPF